MRMIIATLSRNTKAMTNDYLIDEIDMLTLLADVEEVRDQIRTTTRALTIDIDLHHNE